MTTCWRGSFNKMQPKAIAPEDLPNLELVYQKAFCGRALFGPAGEAWKKGRREGRGRGYLSLSSFLILETKNIEYINQSSVGN